jgi:hypothetical protein
VHPAGLPGEIPGKGSNIAWAARRAKEELIDGHQSSLPAEASAKVGVISHMYENILVSAFDIDTQAPPDYFARLTHAFLTVPDPLRAIYQPIPLFTNNIYQAPLLARIGGEIERIEGFAKPEEWERAFDEIKDFERHLVDERNVLVKFWLQIDKEEQLKRFKLREQNADKKWKITDEDWRNRKKWDQYYQAIGDMVRLTSTPQAPWTLVEANDKLWARVKILKTIVDTIAEKLDS